jgi:hypothetical protein
VLKSSQTPLRFDKRLTKQGISRHEDGLGGVAQPSVARAVCAAGWLDPDERVSGGIDLDAWCVATSVRQGSSMKIEEATWSKPLADLQTRV